MFNVQYLSQLIIAMINEIITTLNHFNSLSGCWVFILKEKEHLINYFKGY